MYNSLTKKETNENDLNKKEKRKDWSKKIDDLMYDEYMYAWYAVKKAKCIRWSDSNLELIWIKHKFNVFE